MWDGLLLFVGLVDCCDCYYHPYYCHQCCCYYPSTPLYSCPFSIHSSSLELPYFDLALHHHRMISKQFAISVLEILSSQKYQSIFFIEERMKTKRNGGRRQKRKLKKRNHETNSEERPGRRFNKWTFDYSLLFFSSSTAGR